MTIPKEDERTPDCHAARTPMEDRWRAFVNAISKPGAVVSIDVPDEFRTIWDSHSFGASTQFIAERVKAGNAYNSTDALRSALAEALAWHERRIELVKDYRCLTTDLATRYEQHTEQIEAIRAALSGSPAPSTEGLREWQPIETAPHDDYRTILVVVEAPDGDLTHRLAMWEPENDDWTVFMANWNPQPLFWMPLPPAPDAARTALAGKHHR